MMNGRLDEQRVRLAVSVVGEKKPRGYLGILTALSKLVKAEVHKSILHVESCTSLEAAQLQDILGKIQKQFPTPLIPKQSVNPSLVGGLRIKIGSNIWDGSVAAKLKRLRLS
jgi:F-type H+-transporting ATPase subunit delta